MLQSSICWICFVFIQEFFSVQLIYFPSLAMICFFLDEFRFLVCESRLYRVNAPRKTCLGLCVSPLCPKHQGLYCLDMQSANKKAGLSSAVLLKQARAGLFISLWFSPQWLLPLFCYALVLLFLSFCSGLRGQRTSHQGRRSCRCWGVSWSWL